MFIVIKGGIYLSSSGKDNRYVYLIRMQGKRIPVVYDHAFSLPVTVLTYRKSMGWVSEFN